MYYFMAVVLKVVPDHHQKGVDIFSLGHPERCIKNTKHFHPLHFDLMAETRLIKDTGLVQIAVLFSLSSFYTQCLNFPLGELHQDIQSVRRGSPVKPFAAWVRLLK